MKRIIILLFIAVIGTFSVSFGQSPTKGTTDITTKATKKKTKGSKDSKDSKESSSSSSNSAKIAKSFAKAQRSANSNSLSIFPSMSSSGSAFNLFSTANSSSNFSIFTPTKLSVFSPPDLGAAQSGSSSMMPSSKSAWTLPSSTDLSSTHKYIRFRRPQINSPYFQSKPTFTFSGNMKAEKTKTQQTKTLEIAKYEKDAAAARSTRKYDPVLYYLGQ